jgi:niacin transporter
MVQTQVREVRSSRLNSIQLAFAGVFTALALVIPLAFRGVLQIVIPTIGYSATLASHVPVMLSMIAGPYATALVGVGSTIGFFATLGPIVAARAASHIAFGVAAAIALKKGMSYPKALFLVALPIHAVLEGFVVIPFGVPLAGALINLGGAAIHHVADSLISIVIFKAVKPVIRSLKLPGIAK